MSNKSKQILRDLADTLQDDVVASIESIGYLGVYCFLPDLKVSDKGSIKKLKVSAYSSQLKDDRLLHKLFGKIKEQATKT